MTDSSNLGFSDIKDDTENDGAPALFAALTDAGLDTCLAVSFAAHKRPSDRAWDRAFRNSSFRGRIRGRNRFD